MGSWGQVPNGCTSCRHLEQNCKPHENLRQDAFKPLTRDAQEQTGHFKYL